ncbi:MAG: hypothetical protein COB09_18995 [Thalassobium sp.]|nr:MAG: hypothetical protein COB09_18995 [Thalassobium sp.]
MKQIKIPDHVYARMESLSTFHGMGIPNISEALLVYACKKFEKDGITLPPMGNTDFNREDLVNESIEISKLGTLKYVEWLAKLSPAEENALKYCIKAHKKVAEAATKKTALENMGIA